MTSRERVLYIEHQIHIMLRGEQTDFVCPFCELTTTEGNGILCCAEAAEVVNAILDHIEHLERCEIVDAVMDRFSETESRILLN